MTNASCTLLLLSDRSSTVRAMRPRLPKRCCHVGKPYNAKQRQAASRIPTTAASRRRREPRNTHTHLRSFFVASRTAMVQEYLFA
uniref:Putative secreted protein n=1 Tax=Ixodes ricinus TaxID=34613 RepID=A0A6B0U763_IXORI